MNNEDMGALVHQVLEQQDTLAEALSHMRCQAARLRSCAEVICDVLGEDKTPSAVELRNLEHSLRNHVYASYEQLNERREAAATAADALENFEPELKGAGLSVLRRA